MKQILKQSLVMAVLVLSSLLVPQKASAQYKMVVKTTDGLKTDYFVNSIDSIFWIYSKPEEQGNDDGETTVIGDAYDITGYSAKIKSWANVLDNLSNDISIGLIYCTEGTPSKSNGTKIEVSKSLLEADASYIVKLTNLAPNTTYYYRSYVYQSGMYFYGKVKSFTTNTQSANVSLSTGESTKLTYYSAKVSGSVIVNPTDQYSISYGICYGTDTMPNVDGNKLEASSKDENGTFTCQLRALSGSTTYYYRSYAEVDGYLSYGPQRSFTTKSDDVVITREIDTATYIVTSTLTIGGGAYSTLKLGVCYGSAAEPTVDNQTVTTDEVDDEGRYALQLTGMTEGTVYYRAFVLIDGVAHYGTIKSFEHVIDANGHAYVDLGLPSGTLWATCNVGAEKPEDYGDYFAWGETTGYNSGKTNFEWSTYKWCNGSRKTMTKYCTSSSYGTVDNKTELELDDDAARANWGGSWRMPSSAQIDELKSECSTKWITQGGVYGLKVTSKKNGNSIFLPAAGSRYGSSLNDVGSYGYYWSRSLIESYSNLAYSLYFYSGAFCLNSDYRYIGQSVRPVVSE